MKREAMMHSAFAIIFLASIAIAVRPARDEVDLDGNQVEEVFTQNSLSFETWLHSDISQAEGIMGQILQELEGERRDLLFMVSPPPPHPTEPSLPSTEMPQNTDFSCKQVQAASSGLLAPGQDCWGPCEEKSGCCPKCGQDKACCRKGDASPAVCKGTTGYTRMYGHECVPVLSCDERKTAFSVEESNFNNLLERVEKEPKEKRGFSSFAQIVHAFTKLNGHIGNAAQVGCQVHSSATKEGLKRFKEMLEKDYTDDSNRGCDGISLSGLPTVEEKPPKDAFGSLMAQIVQTLQTASECKGPMVGEGGDQAERLVEDEERQLDNEEEQLTVLARKADTVTSASSIPSSIPGSISMLQKSQRGVGGLLKWFVWLIFKLMALCLQIMEAYVCAYIKLVKGLFHGLAKLYIGIYSLIGCLCRSVVKSFFELIRGKPIKPDFIHCLGAVQGAIDKVFLTASYDDKHYWEDVGRHMFQCISNSDWNWMKPIGNAGRAVQEKMKDWRDQ
eukprot:TRINITY_DN106287_c0_g1_i1.p1 TRINITY_DN106287_c0_g1~~TRINITY_DN106287_c0_g1_i1.p1  ORF type:complete len:502 (-),score=67.04 TRINITY_DN106287_c0_g1_i1:35-1540(-)